MKLVSLVVVGLTSLTLLGCSKGDSSKSAVSTSTATVVAKNPGAVKVEFFVMSQCPYGVQVMNGVKDSIEALGPDVDFQFDFIGQKGPNGELTSMHGPNEVTGDIVQLCAAKQAPSNVLKMIACQNKKPTDVATNWEACAKENNIPVEPLRACLTGDEGKTLLTESFARAAARGARGSPTMFVAQKPYQGRRGSKDFMRGICAEFKEPNVPAACKSLPEAPKVTVTILNDKRCAECNFDRLVSIVQNQVTSPVITQLDYGTEEGRAMYDKVTSGGDGLLPMVLFDDTIKADTEAMAGLSRHLRPAGSMQMLNIGASFLPACANEGGCALPQCKETLGCRTEAPKKLEVFVMSQCPYGVKALNAMQEVLANFDDLDFQVNFIGTGAAQTGFQSLHGQPEVDEDLRELCAIKKYGKKAKFMDYVLCRNKDIRSTEWEKCAVSGIDPKVIKACAEGPEGKKLLEENFKIANSMGIGSSPTWLANNKFKFAGIDAQTIKTNLCAHNPTLKGCDKTLSAATGAPVDPGACK